MFAQKIALFALLAISVTSSARELRENEMIIGGGRAEADGLAISAPSFTVRRGQPIVSAATIQPPGEAPRFAYLLVVKGDEGRKHFAGVDGQCEVKGLSARSFGSVEIAGSKAAFDYAWTFDSVRNVAKETLLIDGQSIDVTKGRVLLIDVSGKKVVWNQVTAELPRKPTSPVETNDVEKQSQSLLTHLKGEKSVREFLK